MLKFAISIFKTRWMAPAVSVALGLAMAAVTVVLAMGGTISGTVTAPGGGLPPAGTVVKLFEPGEDSVFGEGNVDGSGNFSLGPLPNGLYVIKAVPPVASGLTQSEPVPVSVLNGPVSGLTLSLTDPQITGTVTTPDGVTPITASVKVFLGNGLLFQVVEAPGGAFAIGGLPIGSYALRAHPATDDPFWFSAPQPVTVSGGGTQSFTLTLTAAQLWGVTRDSLNNPVPHARVHAVNRSATALRRSDLSSPSGFWAIGGLPAGNYHLLAQPPFNQKELVPPRPVTVTLPGGATNPYTLTFTSAPKIVSGTVTSNLGGSGGLPVDQARVLAHRVDKHGRAETLTAPDGTYRLNLSAGLWAMTVKPISTTNPPHWVFPLPPQLVHFQHNTEVEEKRQDFQVIVADAQIDGLVELPGGGAPSFTVTVGVFNNEGIGRRTTIAATGAFSVRVPHGGYKVVVHPHDPQYLGPTVDPIRVEPNTTYDLGTLTLVVKDATITGTVRDSGGQGVAGIPVTAWRAGAPDTLHTRSGLDGTYILPVTAGDWHVQPAPGPMQPYVYGGSGARVSLVSGQVVTDVDFDLVTADATINGQLVDEDGNPLNDIDGWARAASTGNANRHTGAPIEDGFFSIYVPAGEYNVAASLPAGAPYMSGAEKKVSLNAGETVTITLDLLEKNATIQGFLWDPRNEAVVSGVEGVVGAWAGGNWAGTSINAGNGTYRFDVAAGLWHLGYRIDPDAGYIKLVQHKNVPVQAGSPANVALPVVFKDGAIAGTVLGPAGSPRAGVRVIAHAISSRVKNVNLHTLSGPDGRFELPVPHGEYRLGAVGGGPGVIKPAEKRVVVGPNQTSGGHVLQFQLPDATLSGTLTISSSSPLDGEALVWAWTEDGGFIKGHFPITGSTGSYSLNIISNTTWHVGAAFETNTQFWGTRKTVAVGSGNATQNLVLSGPHPKPGPVVVTFDTANAQRIALADGTHVFIPAGAMPVSGEVTLRVVPIATLPHQQHANVYKYGYAFLATDSNGQPIEDHFNQDVIIGFSYTDDELANLGILEGNLKPAYFSTTDDHWTFPDSYAVDTGANVVTMQIDHFTDFALTSGAVEVIYLPIVLR